MAIDITQRLLDWYAQHARKLPWREFPQAYSTWVAEIMLQQTRVDTVIPYFQRWMVRFPTLIDLAKATEQEVLQIWEGLGYYSRARNLHHAAGIIVHEYDGQLPQERRLLEKLHGIGSYTAGAITSIAFGQNEIALDGNIRRVLSRLFDVKHLARSPEGERQLSQLANQHLPSGQAGDFNQALMDLGATICTPRAPGCSLCPLKDLCRANDLGIQEERPIKLKRPPIPHLTVTAAVIHRNGNILLAQRPPNGLLGGLWEFPGGKVEPGEELDAALRREISEELGVKISIEESCGKYRHAYTHYKVTLYAFYCQLIDGEPQALEASELRWVTRDQLADFPMGKIDRQISLRLEKGEVQ